MSAARLSAATLVKVRAGIRKPAYDRALLKHGIVHLGLGAFHRAHQAAYTEDCLEAGDPRWGIVGASLRSPETRDALAPQDGLYTLEARDGDARDLRIIGAVKHILVGPENPQRLLEALCHPDTGIVSLTITEKGYCLEPSSGHLNESDPGIRHDLADPSQPRTAPGFIVESLARRRASGLAPFTVLSCDNLSHNGDTVHTLLTRFATLRGGDLGAFVNAEVPCPNTMVDRIVPATTAQDRDAVGAALGLTDAWPVMTEPFTQWVIEDRFAQGRPEWERAGAMMVKNVAPFELMKLRLLNGPHSAIAYLGSLAGLATVADVMATDIADFASALMDDARATLSDPPDIDIAAYKASLLARFRNRALMHKTIQIAMDGSMKMPPRIVQPVRDALRRNVPIARYALVIAAWMTFLRGQDEAGRPLSISDPMAETLFKIVRAETADIRARAAALLALDPIFGDVGREPRLIDAVADALSALERLGARAAAAHYAHIAR